MQNTKLGRTLVIVNPASQSGKGKECGEFIDRFLASYKTATTSYDMYYTKAPADAEAKAASAEQYDTVLAVGGDGVIHEIVNGLMQIDAHQRPTLGLIPIGSGNDFARTLHMALSDPTASLGQVLQGTPVALDLGRVNGVYFAETLSFGLDAAIAIDTMERRKKTGYHGTRLFAESGVEVFGGYSHGWHYTARIDGGVPFEGEEIVFACQVGPTYGGGFKICPDASPVDGKLDLCRNIKMPKKPWALALFAAARFGGHVRSKLISSTTFTSLHIDFKEEPPVQIDGELFGGTSFDIACMPKALRVIVPNSCKFSPNHTKVEGPSVGQGLLGTKLADALKESKK